jgi:hypothetical protein
MGNMTVGGICARVISTVGTHSGTRLGFNILIHNTFDEKKQTDRRFIHETPADLFTPRDAFHPGAALRV